MWAALLDLLLDATLGLLALAALARFWMQAARISMRQPIGRLLMSATDWFVLPVRRWLPAFLGLDWASLVLAYCALCAKRLLFALLLGGVGAVGANAGLLLFFAAIDGVRLFIYLLMGIVIIAAVLSWFNPYSPWMALMDQLARPLLAPVRRILPTFSGIDLSPLVVLLVLQAALILIANLSWPP
ncbi:MAG: YggT family protein [Rhodocyclaceae bacterium]|nr:YggT family protein [Rhodocyclaceae bacterium]